MKFWMVAGVLVATPTILAAQSGAIAGRVTDAGTGNPIPEARVQVEDEGLMVFTDGEGRFRLRGVRPGSHSVTATALGYRTTRRANITVTSGQAVVLTFSLTPQGIKLPEIMVESEIDQLLDPRVTETVQRITAAELRELPVTTVHEALILQAGVVGGSYRGGRLGQESFVIDGLGVKNNLDASSGALGLNVPTSVLQEATLVTNGFSAQYGQALSGVITLVTRDGGDELHGFVAYESDRLLPDGWDFGLDRINLMIEGPVGVGRATFLAALDAQARVDDDPVNAPAPEDPLDPRSERPWLLPHNTGERYDVTAKLTVPIGINYRVRMLGIASSGNRLLFDPQLKYSPRQGPAEETKGRFGLIHLQTTPAMGSSNTTMLDLRLGFFEKSALRGVLVNQPDRKFGAFTLGDFEFAGEQLAEAGDSIGALQAIGGFNVPVPATSPWGVPAFFMTESTRGELARNLFRELRVRLDLLLGRGLDTDLRVGGEFVRQHVETFTRLESYRSVSSGAPEPRLSAFDPFSAAGYTEVEHRIEDLAFTAGLRVDAFNARSGAEMGELDTKLAVSPRFALSTVLEGATVVVSFGRFAQAPDFQFLVDAAFDDTLRTGRFRRGNPGLGFETSWQYEFSVRYRPTPITGVKVGVYFKRLDGLVSSVPIGFDSDSAIFANADFGTVRGVELTIEREFRSGVGGRLIYVLQEAKATASDAFDFFRRLRISPIGDTIRPASLEIPLDFDQRHSFIGLIRGHVSPAAGPVLAGLEAAAIAKWSSGLPFTRTNLAGDSIIGIPNGERLPSRFSIDVLVRRAFNIGGIRIGFYVDIRNVTDRRNIVAVRRDTGTPGAGELQIAQMAASAFSANPAPIPFESQRYNPLFDLDGDGLISGANELLPLYGRAARDFLQPTFAFGPPRLVRLGTEIVF